RQQRAFVRDGVQLHLPVQPPRNPRGKLDPGFVHLGHASSKMFVRVACGEVGGAPGSVVLRKRRPMVGWDAGREPRGGFAVETPPTLAAQALLCTPHADEKPWFFRGLRLAAASGGGGSRQGSRQKPWRTGYLRRRIARKHGKQGNGGRNVTGCGAPHTRPRVRFPQSARMRPGSARQQRFLVPAPGYSNARR